MSFENGYDINEYISDTIKLYEDDNKIFDKALKALEFFMRRSDWPVGYKDYEKASYDILGYSSEWICRTISMFRSQSEKGDINLKDWDKSLDKDFKRDIFYFVDIVDPVKEEYYTYIDNPLGISRIINIDRNGNRRLIRIIRADGEHLDIRMGSYEIEQFIKNLEDIMPKG